jgi:hypothetical protein
MVLGRAYQDAGESCIMRSFIICTLHKYNYDGQMKNDEIGKACSEYQMRNSYTNLVGNSRGRD